MSNIEFEKWVNQVSEWQDVAKNVPVLVQQDIMKGKYRPEKPEHGFKSHTFDPLAVQYSMGFKDRKYSLSYDVLKRIPQQLSIVASILQTRCNQVGSFCVPYRSSKSLGFVIKHKDSAKLTTKGEREMIKELEQFIYNCGSSKPNKHNLDVQRDDFEGFLKKIVRDSLMYDQATFEVVPDHRGMPFEFMAVDASTIRLATQKSIFGPNSTWHNRPAVISNDFLLSGHENPYRTMKLYNRDPSERPAFVQVINGQIENVYTRDELAFGVRNPRTDIYIQGYGYGELEQLVTVITSHLYAEEYNRRFFMQGCVAGDTKVYTESGIANISDLVGQSFKVWNGTEFVEADAVYSGYKQVVTTTLSNKASITTSPDHKFLTLDDTGNMTMRPISSLVVGDFIAQADKVVDFAPVEPLRIKYGTSHQCPVADLGPADKDFYEFVGWLVGDGWTNKHSINHSLTTEEAKSLGKRKRDTHTVSAVFGPKDKEMQEKVEAYLASLGISYLTRLSGGAWGGQQIPTISIKNKGFYEFLNEEVGVCNEKAHKKVVPTRMFTETVENRAAFLRGLFSADGTCVKYGKSAIVRLATSSKALFDGVQHLLWSLGISSTLDHVLMNNSGRPCYYLGVTDLAKFFSLVGFSLSYKSENYTECRTSAAGGRIPLSIQKKVLAQADLSLLTVQQRVRARKILRDTTKSGFSREYLSTLCAAQNIKALELNYRWVTIRGVEVSDLHIPMYDIRQTHELHQWSAGSCVVSNSAPKGALVFKGDSMTPDQLEAFRRQWRANLEGVENCLAGDSKIYTQEYGFASLSDICGEKEEVQATIWTGTEWATGLVYKTAESKELCYMNTDNGITVGSSPDHKFRVIDETGDPVWRTQREIQVGDCLLVNKLDTGLGTELLCFGTPVDADMWEALGWLLGDGSIGDRDVRWFYHHEKEQGLLDKHLSSIQKYFPKATKHTIHRTEEDKQKLIDTYGFKTVSDTVTRITLNDSRAVAWLSSHGFTKDGKKSIPSYLYTAPEEMRAAYLRGFFSADGNNHKGTSPCITIASSDIREATKHLLLSVGIRTCLSEGKTKTSFSGCERILVSGESVLRVKDRDAFFRKVGFLQDHKQPVSAKKSNEKGKSDFVPIFTVRKYLLKVREANSLSGFKLLTKRERMDLNSILSGSDGCSKTRLLRYMETAGLAVPSWLVDFHTARVVSKKNTNLFVPMFDVSINSPEHEFVCNNIRCSNSWRTPIFQSEQGVDWMDLGKTNQEMEYNAWMEYLIKLTCGVFLIDPAELNFDLHGGVSQTPLFESSQEWKLKASRDRGLKPMLRFIAKMINDNIIDKIDDHFMFDFVGLDELTEQEKHELRKEQVSSYMTLNEIRRAEDLPDVEYGNMVLNPTYIQAMQAASTMQQQEAQAQQMQGGQPGQAPAPGGQPGDQGQGQEQPQQNSAPAYADTYAKSLTVKSQDGVKFLEISLDDWLTETR